MLVLSQKWLETLMDAALIDSTSGLIPGEFHGRSAHCPPYDSCFAIWRDGSTPLDCALLASQLLFISLLFFMSTKFMEHHPKLERWEKIERFVLLSTATALIAGPAIRFALGYGGLPQFLFVPFGFWCIWQALYEDRLDDNSPITRGELVLASLWMWTRRLVLSAVGAFWLFAGYHMALVPARTVLETVVGLMMTIPLAGIAFWVAFFGGGISKSFNDDKNVHARRRARYKWWV